MSPPNFKISSIIVYLMETNVPNFTHILHAYTFLLCLYDYNDRIQEKVWPDTHGNT